jgi:hypothetical protein
MTGHHPISVAMCKLLNRMYPNRWIGRGGLRYWTPRSPDLNPLDFFLWGVREKRCLQPIHS